MDNIISKFLWSDPCSEDFKNINIDTFLKITDHLRNSHNPRYNNCEKRYQIFISNITQQQWDEFSEYQKIKLIKLDGFNIFNISP